MKKKLMVPASSIILITLLMNLTAHAQINSKYDFKKGSGLTIAAGAVFVLDPIISYQKLFDPKDFKTINGRKKFVLDSLKWDTCHLKTQKIFFIDRGIVKRANSSDCVASLTDIGLATSFALPFIAFSLNDQTRNDYGTLLLMNLEVFLLNYDLTQLTKTIATRPRPYYYQKSYAELKNDKESVISFFSGHSSTTASFSIYTAKVLTDYNHRHEGYVWAGCALLPVLTGIGRIVADKHFPTDVVVGWLVGGAIGYLVPKMNERTN